MKTWSLKSNWVSCLGLWRGVQVCKRSGRGDKGVLKGQAGLFQDRLPGCPAPCPPSSLHWLLGLFPLCRAVEDSACNSPSATWLQPGLLVSSEVTLLTPFSMWALRASPLGDLSYTSPRALSAPLQLLLSPVISPKAYIIHCPSWGLYNCMVYLEDLTWAGDIWGIAGCPLGKVSVNTACFPSQKESPLLNKQQRRSLKGEESLPQSMSYGAFLLPTQNLGSLDQ